MNKSLFMKVKKKYREALDSGALRSYTTDCRLVRNGTEFIVFVLNNLSEREKSSWDAYKKRSPGEKAFDPFLPYEKDLFVDDLSDTHICLLNKYNIIRDHILIVTRSFEEQESPLTGRDFEAMWICMEEIGGLAFYNSGEKAGASQRHKHMQLVSLPIGATANLPIEPFILGMYSGSGEAVRSIKEFGFRHGLLFIPPGARAGFIYEKYQILADFTGLAKEWGPYNLLVTRGWMMLIPRMQERYEGISINSLGFAGSILVKDPLEFELIEQAGLFKILSSVGLPLK